MSGNGQTGTSSRVAVGAALGAAAGILAGGPSLLSSGFSDSVVFMAALVILGFSLLGAWLAAISRLSKLDELNTGGMRASAGKPPQPRGFALLADDQRGMHSGANRPEAA